MDESWRGRKKRQREGPEARGVTEAFAMWLERRLHDLYDEAMREPVPADLLRLIEGRRPDHDQKH
jgi:hypothetical protein